MDEMTIPRLRANADRCRVLADKATDQEVARILQETAADIEAAIPILEATNHREVSGDYRAD
jgi:hypothetical protein